MKLARIKLEVSIPDNVTDDEAVEWLRFVLNHNGEMSLSNPLVDTEFEPNFFEVVFLEPATRS